MYFPHFHFPHLNYLIKRDLNNFFLSTLIRYFAVGMIILFEPIYIYLFFDKSLSLTLIYFASIHFLYGLLAVYSGKLIAKIGLQKCILLGNIALFLYYLTLYNLMNFHWLIFLGVLLSTLSKALFWPAFHIDFVRFSSQKDRGVEVGKWTALKIIPVVIAPAIGGWIVALYGYPVLFVVVLIVLLISTIPLFLAKEIKEKYKDSYEKAWLRVLRPENKFKTLAIGSAGIETGTSRYIWPIFLQTIALSSLDIGGISSFALGTSALFSLYLGKTMKKEKNQEKMLKLGSILVSTAWILKSFVKNSFEALLARTFYRFLGTTMAISFSTVFYNLADKQKDEADEFIIYREIVLNISRALFFFFLAIIFTFTSNIVLAFWITALFSLTLFNIKN